MPCATSMPVWPGILMSGKAMSGSCAAMRAAALVAVGGFGDDLKFWPERSKLVAKVVTQQKGFVVGDEGSGHGQLQEGSGAFVPAIVMASQGGTRHRRFYSGTLMVMSVPGLASATAVSVARPS